MINNVFIFIAALFMVIKGATLATRYAGELAENYRLSRYVVGFIIVAVISVLPEAFIAINAAFENIPAFGLGMLFGSNIADLTLVFALLVLLTGRKLKIESKILKNHVAYPFILLLPLVLGFNGHFSRLEGVALILAGSLFYYLALRDDIGGATPIRGGDSKLKSLLFLLLSMAVLLIGAHFSVTSATFLAEYAGVDALLIGMFIVALGTTMPELFFSLKSVKKGDDSLAVGDILGTVLADATIVVGILAVIHPFYFPQKIIYITGVCMVLAAFVLFSFMRTGKTLTKREAWMLCVFWLVFVVIELVANG